MSFKQMFMLGIMAMLLSSFAFAQYGYGYDTSNGDDDDRKRMTLAFESGCDGNVVTANGASYPLEGVHVTVMDAAGGLLFSGDTDANGQVSFEGCGRDVRVYASRSGYKNADLSGVLVACEQCEEPEEELPPQEEQPEEPGTQYECTTDADCAGNEYCLQAAVGAALGGTCEEVTGDCGVVANHAFTAYECGTEPGCPSCPQGEMCSGNVCYPAEMTGPDNGETGDEVTYTVSLGGAPCAGLEVLVTDPTGAVTTYITDANCQITFPLTGPGQYRVVLSDDGNPLASKSVISTSPQGGEEPAGTPAAPEGEGQQGDGGSGLFGLLLMLLLLLLLALGLWYLVLPMFQKGKK